MTIQEILGLAILILIAGYIGGFVGSDSRHTNLLTWIFISTVTAVIGAVIGSFLNSFYNIGLFSGIFFGGIVFPYVLRSQITSFEEDASRALQSDMIALTFFALLFAIIRGLTGVAQPDWSLLLFGVFLFATIIALTWPGLN